MWFLLQLIDHNIHESNEVTGSAPFRVQVEENSFCFLTLLAFPSSALVPTDHDDLQLLCGDKLFLDVRRGLLPSHRHRHDLFNR